MSRDDRRISKANTDTTTASDYLGITLLKTRLRHERQNVIHILICKTQNITSHHMGSMVTTHIL